MAIKFSGRRLTDLFYRGNPQVLWARFSPELKEIFENIDGLKSFYRKFFDLVGEEKRLLSEKVSQGPGGKSYTRHAKGKRGFSIKWVWDETGTVIGFSVRPEAQLAPSRFLQYQTKTPLNLPFEGLWFVFWGGRSIEQNAHASWANQRFAYDFLVKVNDKSYQTDGKKNEDYYCFGKTIFAPGPGTVIEVENNTPDNIPGQTNSKNPLGNYVVIDHHNGEYSFFAHFKQGSIRVNLGDTLQPGDILAQCGNSGNSSEPHLHYHLQNRPQFEKGAGLPAQFIDFLVNGKPINKGELIKGQVIEAK